MTRKDYVAFANELGIALGELRTIAADLNETDCAVLTGFDKALEAMVRVFEADNSNFRRSQFYEALEYRASTGRLVRVGQTRFDV